MTRSGIYQVRPVPVRDLGPTLIDAMWRLYADYYDNVTRAAFDRDLAEKTLVFVGTDTGSGALAGFSTALFYRHVHRGRRVGIYFSGDTIVEPRYWGQQALHRSVVRTLAMWKLRHPLTPLYWHLICSGYRTYLTMVRNFPAHWPHHERPTPAWESGLIDSIGRARYGRAWQPERGVVSFGGAQPVLKAAVAPLTRDVLALPEIRFFVDRNPGYLRGDELAMIGLVDHHAIVHMGGKWLRAVLRRAASRRRAPATRLARPAH
jgi:hypothetical protein